jgi:hypothetical protein
MFLPFVKSVVSNFGRCLYRRLLGVLRRVTNMLITLVGLFPSTSRALMSAALGTFNGDEDKV